MTEHRYRLLRLPSRSRPLLTGVTFVGDLLLLLLFTAVGIYTHGGYAWEMPMYTLETLFPFLLAWVIIAPVVGLYHRETLGDYKSTAIRLTIGWIAVSLLGGAIRATDYFLGGAPLDFIAVNIIFGLLFLLPWRFAIAWVLGRN